MDVLETTNHVCVRAEASSKEEYTPGTKELIKSLRLGTSQVLWENLLLMLYPVT